MPYVETSIAIAAPARVVYELAKDQGRFPEFMPDVESVSILERHPEFVLSRWKTLVEEAPIEWTEEDRFDDVNLRIDYRLLEGDLDKFEGSWTFRESAGETHVQLGVDYDFGVPTLAELIGPTLERKVRENSEMMLAALKKEAEAYCHAELVASTELSTGSAGSSEVETSPSSVALRRAQGDTDG
jgi:coenzyme Q-binding protein COQ10